MTMNQTTSVTPAHTAAVIDGVALSAKLREDVTRRTLALKARGVTPGLAVLLVGDNPASAVYVRNKVKACADSGLHSLLERYDADLTEAALLARIDALNQDPSIHGILVQMPVPAHIDANKVIEAIAPGKDVDGFHPINVGKMSKGLPAFISATPLGILRMLEQYGIETSGKHCVVIGRSQIVGLPMSILMQRNAYPGNCTVTICHSNTKDLAQHTLQADIVIAAIGIPQFLKADMVKEGAVIIDVGITRVADATKKSGFAIKGDVDFEAVGEKASYITPVPGGVGLMTICGLLENTLHAAKGTYYQK
jgi:methylenetetrahydrofolate dehydrogenase (NADP+)/methenyltetrahydrofolate cyclohydrolase